MKEIEKLFDAIKSVLPLESYDKRKVGRYEKGDLFVSTVKVHDSEHPYETGVRHPDFNNGEIIIVQSYDDKTEAKKGHKRWIKKMAGKTLPKTILDVSSAKIAKVADTFNGKNWRIKNPKRS